MPDFKDLVQKAFFLGVGAASYAAERAGTTLTELRSQAQKLADEMVAKGEITTEDAKRMVDEMVSRAQQSPNPPASDTPASEPRRIEILSDDADEPPSPEPVAQVDDLRQQVAKLQEELRRLKRQ